MIEDPAVEARRIGDQLAVDCPHCKDEHRHGAIGPKLGDGDGHRIAHCSSGTGRGYFLKEAARA
ncbi:hypothetical protein [Streptomyces sp. NPDC006267]|uniref:hypothetical protein n=1 Tax=Streptomyces sp. NPDC006267 TaxID=3157173 RepID=UPI0033A55ED1